MAHRIKNLPPRSSHSSLKLANKPIDPHAEIRTRSNPLDGLIRLGPLTTISPVSDPAVDPRSVAANPLYGKEIIAELFIPSELTAGLASNIWPIINAEYKKEGKLGIRQIDNPMNAYYFMYTKNDNTPLFRNGTFTAIYKIFKLNDIEKRFNNKIYILRIYERETTISTENMLNIPKIQEEFRLFNKYMINIYNYGVINKLNFDFIITDEYNTVDSNEVYYQLILTNKQRIQFIINVVKMLNDLYKENHIHGDLKIINIGWNNFDELQPVLIDYDISTLQKIEPTNPVFELSGDIVTNYYFIRTYVPNYINSNTTLQQFDMFSIGGLVNIIESLPLNYTDIDEHSAYIISQGLIKYLKLDETDYNNLYSYEEMLIRLESIKYWYVTDTP